MADRGLPIFTKLCNAKPQNEPQVVIGYTMFEKHSTRPAIRCTTREAQELPSAASKHRIAAPMPPNAAPDHPSAAPEHPGAALEQLGAASEYPRAAPEHPYAAPEHPSVQPQSTSVQPQSLPETIDF